MFFKLDCSIGSGVFICIFHLAPQTLNVAVDISIAERHVVYFAMQKERKKERNTPCGEICVVCVPYVRNRLKFILYKQKISDEIVCLLNLKYLCGSLCVLMFYLFSQQRLPFNRERFLPRRSPVGLPQVSPSSFGSAVI